MSVAAMQDVQRFRRTMGCFATGVAVVTTQLEGQPFGMTINSLTSVSLDPMVILVSLAKGSTTGAAIRRRCRFAVNLLREEQEAVSRRFVAKDGHRFDDDSWRGGDWDVPLLPQRLAHLVCDVHLVHDVGDHEVVYGRVLDCEAYEGRPLLYWRGSYSNLTRVAA
jgi:flavin reductase (DIM6/NTAB) family NADH-FMN oxidoreductase RutF